MIYTASYSESQNHHGKLVPISRGTYKNVSTKNALPFFMPSSNLLKDWKAKKLTKEQYINIFREEMRANLPQIKEWLNSLDPKEDQTLVCYEKAGEFCHRNLIIKFVQRDRPDCFGGCDVPNKKVLVTV